MDINAAWDGASAVIGAVVAGAGTVMAWIAKNKKIWFPIVEAVGADPNTKKFVYDVHAAIAAKDSALRNAELRAAMLEGLLVIVNPGTELGQTEKWIFHNYVSQKLPPEIQPYVNLQTIDALLNSLPNVISEAQKGEWYQAIQQLRAQSANSNQGA